MYKNQELPELTQEMYLSEWEQMVVRYGIQDFQVALLKAIRESRFFPDPFSIREFCEAKRRAVSDRNAALEAIRKQDEARAQWERERAEGSASGNQVAEPEPAKLWSPRQVLKDYRAVPRRQERTPEQEAADDAERDRKRALAEQFQRQYGKAESEVAA